MSAPFHAESDEFVVEGRSDTAQLRALESVALPQFRRPIRAMQDEDRFAACALDVHMRRTMIVRVDDDPQAIQAQDCRHAAL